MDNIERFNQVTGLVFAHLYEHFPVPQTMSDTLFPALSEPCEYVSGADFYVHTVRWLVASGYLTHSKQSFGAPHVFEHTILTAKGLEVLKTVPESIAGTTAKSIGAQLQTAVKAGVLDTMKSLTGKALSIGASMAYTSISGLIPA